MKPNIDFPQNVSYDKIQKSIFENILERMFPNYDRIDVVEEFTEGVSGSWVFFVELFRNNALLLPVVVKIAAASLIKKEWQAYHKHIKGKLAYIAKIEEEPVYDTKTGYAGLYYNHAGEGIHRVESLRKFLRKSSLDDIHFVLKERIATIFEFGLQNNSKKFLRYHLHASYDPILPVNLLIKPLILSTERELPLLTPDDMPPPNKLSNFKKDDQLRLIDFVVTKVDLRAKTVTLNLPSSESELRRDSFVVRLKYDSDAEIPAFITGQPLPEAIDGEILKTRQDQWGEEMRKVFDNQPFDFADAEVQLPTGISLPNPFKQLPEILFQRCDINVNDIHGDLNLENILVDPQVRDVRLIDFAEARYDHVLHDFLRLETEVITKLIPPALIEAHLPPDVIYPFYIQLHEATFGTDKPEATLKPYECLTLAFTIIKQIRQIFRVHGLFTPNDYKEYYQCLTLYLLGALKFRNLDKESAIAPYPKQAAFWAAATLLSLLERKEDTIDPLPLRLRPPLPEMIRIPAGEFLMGSDPELDKDSQFGEQPQHRLYLPDYYLSRTPITSAQYALFINETGHQPPRDWKNGQPPPGKQLHPVVFVSWHDAVAYCQWFGRRMGGIYRLPSEAEWEKGARGSDGRIYPWGNQWHIGRCNDHSNKLGRPTPVDAFPEGKSPFGLLDMAGNVWEWTTSVLRDYPLDLADVQQDLVEREAMRCVIRGGSFSNISSHSRCAARYVHIASEASRHIGFRILMLAS